jgi:hypothetical protein
MDLTQRDGIERMNRATEREKTPDDSKARDARDSKSFIVMAAAVLVATTLVLGMTWMNNMRYGGTSSRVVAEQGQ